MYYIDALPKAKVSLHKPKILMKPWKVSVISVFS